jgi:hypothetical protein
MMKPLSLTQAQSLTAAAQHPSLLAEAPPNLPAAARSAVLQSMLRAALLEEVSGAEGTVLRITEAGLTALGAQGVPETGREAAVGAQEGGAGQPAGIAVLQGREAPGEHAAPHSRTSLRDTATALLVAWDAGLERPALLTSIEALRAALRRGGAQSVHLATPLDPCGGHAWSGRPHGAGLCGDGTEGAGADLGAHLGGAGSGTGARGGAGRG